MPSLRLIDPVEFELLGPTFGEFSIHAPGANLNACQVRGCLGLPYAELRSNVRSVSVCFKHYEALKLDAA